MRPVWSWPSKHCTYARGNAIRTGVFESHGIYLLLLIARLACFQNRSHKARTPVSSSPKLSSLSESYTFSGCVLNGKCVPVLNQLSPTPWRRMGNWIYGYPALTTRHPLLYPQKLALTSPTSGGISVGIHMYRPTSTNINYHRTPQCNYQACIS
jgi:hypothetical protein